MRFRQTHISKVMIGRPTPRVGGTRSRCPILTDAQMAGWGEPPDIVSAVFNAECLALEERRKALAKVADEFLKPLQPIFEFGPEVDLETAITVVRQTKIEGLVAKRLGSRYVPGQESDLWLKHRFNQQDKFFIGGYIPGSRGIGELLIGEYRDAGKLYHIKRLIAGLNQFTRPEIFEAVQDLKTNQVPL